jgi:hypothetical protein
VGYRRSGGPLDRLLLILTMSDLGSSGFQINRRFTIGN